MGNLRILAILVFIVQLSLIFGSDTQQSDSLAIYLNKSIESRKNNQIEKSVKYLLEGKEFCKTNFQYAKIYNSLGRNYFKLSDYHTAIKYYDSALFLTDSVENNLFVGYLYNNLGLSYTQLMDFETAIRFYHKAIALLDKESIGILFYNISKCFGYIGKKDSTIYYLNKSYKNNYETLGNNSYYTILTELELAEINEKISCSLKERTLTSDSELLKGKYYTIIGDFKQAEKHLTANSKSLLKLYIKFKKWNKAIIIMDSIRNSYLSVDSKLFLQANERSIYKNAIDAEIKSDTLSAFKIALKSHSNVLKENLEYSLEKFPDSYNYFDFDSVIYLFLIEANKPSFYKIKLDTSFQFYYNQFLSTFDLDRIKNDFSNNYTQFAVSSNYLFGQLVPVVKEKMHIVPEGRLIYIPFEALLTEFPDTSAYPRYKELPYLLTGSDISYDYILRGYKKNTEKKSITGLAPDVSLKYAVKEVKSLKAYRSKRYIGKKAKTAMLYKGKILHVATHYDPAAYSIKFTDSTLHLGDIQNLEKDLVVLSTCYSGLGESYTGEGTFSAGRAFYMAGSESVIESLWLNNDRSAYMIFSTFYESLSREMPRGTALTFAKRQYLKDCYNYMSHPFFWANLRLFGNTAHISLKRNSKLYIYLVLGLIVIVVLYQYVFRIHSK